MFSFEPNLKDAISDHLISFLYMKMKLNEYYESLSRIAQSGIHLRRAADSFVFIVSFISLFL